MNLSIEKLRVRARRFRPVFVSLGTLAVLLSFQNCDFIGGPVGQAMRSLAGGSSLPDGVYGISPSALQLKDSRRAGYSNLVVRSTGSGRDVVLNTNFNTGNISGLKANTTYYLDVRGLTGQTETPLANYSVTTWDSFASASWTMTSTASESGKLSLSGSSNVIQWTYAPWKVTAAGDGVLANTSVQCFIVPDQGPSTDPFVAQAKVIQGPAADGQLPFTAADAGISGNVRIGCQMTYADKTVARSSMRRQTLLLPSVSKCPGSDIGVYKTFACGIADVAGTTGATSGLTFAIDPSNTCAWVTVVDNVLTGKPRDPHVGTCSLAFTLSSGGVSSPVIKQDLTISNVKPEWMRTPGDVAPLRETSRNDSGALTGSVLDPARLRSNPAYVLHMVDQFQTNKAAYGVADGATYGAYKMDTSPASNCGRMGLITYVDSAGKIVSGLNPANGEFWFQPHEYVWGSCTIDIYFDDGHATDNRSDLISIPVKILGFNDRPVIVDPGYPKTGFDGAELFTCGEGSSCFVGIDYVMTLQANSGGINEAYPLVSGEGDQRLLMKPGNCVAVNSDPTDKVAYVAVNLCELNPRTGNLQVGFMPLLMPPAGTSVTIKVVASDNGARGDVMASAYNPNPSGTNKNCLSPDKSICVDSPNSFADSEPYAFTLRIDKFNLPIQPALIVSRASCLACHLTITKGDFVTDIGNITPGAAKSRRFVNQFFTGSGDFTSTATHADGYRAMNQLEGNMYVKRATLTRAKNPGFFSRIDNLDRTTGGAYPSLLTDTSGLVVDLVDFLLSPRWTLDKAVRSNGHLYNGSSFAAVCGPYPTAGDKKVGGKVCTPAPVRDTVDVAGAGPQPIDYLTISAPTKEDIQQIAKVSAGIANQIDWTSIEAAVAPLYLQPTDPSVPPRPLSGLVVSKLQPASTLPAGSAPKSVAQSYVTNSGKILCYGDVVVKGDLFLEKPDFVSDNRGCRIHVTGSVIFHAPATNDPAAPAIGNTVTGPGNVGVQITSAEGISIGLTMDGLVDRAAPTATRTAAANLGVPQTTDCMDATKAMLSYLPDQTRVCAKGTTKLNDRSELPSAYRGWGWGYVSYSGLMLNAPSIQGRYQGEFTGSIIANYALFRLGALNFEFDDRFKGQVPFPRLQTIKSALGNHPRIIFDAGPCLGRSTDNWQCDPNAEQ